MKTLALILLTTATATASEMPNCQASIQKAINRIGGNAPQVNCGYAMDEMVVVQKVKDGYLATTNPEYGPDVSREFIFIKTATALEPEQELAGNITYVMPVSYQALDGFEHTVYGFVPVPVPETDERAGAESVPAVDARVIQTLAEK